MHANGYQILMSSISMMLCIIAGKENMKWLVCDKWNSLAPDTCFDSCESCSCACYLMYISLIIFQVLIELQYEFPMLGRLNQLDRIVAILWSVHLKES